jgi:hypothetical protein
VDFDFVGQAVALFDFIFSPNKLGDGASLLLVTTPMSTFELICVSVGLLLLLVMVRLANGSSKDW